MGWFVVLGVWVFWFENRGEVLCVEGETEGIVVSQFERVFGVIHVWRFVVVVVVVVFVAGEVEYRLFSGVECSATRESTH